MTTNSNFNFTNKTIVTLELPFSEHIEELRQRIFLVFGIILLLTCVAFIDIKDLVKILELPSNVKFFSYHQVNILFQLLKYRFIQGYYFQVHL
jgi:Sec-independent protein secretion pathway component TatC